MKMPRVRKMHAETENGHVIQTFLEKSFKNLMLLKKFLQKLMVGGADMQGNEKS